MLNRNAKILFFVIIAFSMVKFMVTEYSLWTTSLACSSKCEVLGCKSGKLIFGEQRRLIGCKCDSKQDYLVLLN
ncbi:hypothetical protein PCIT_b0562 [Pseudoalteromonas citrea]|uniref:Uncharacterized protein n=2 Tax=Pseudoalteromonas citrea TaxID=43655 RepID=A0AAD4FPW9_9GAMM|nr:hypothetical protein [Pseudoalteromonas citrea]KAF7764535.1 hypothetical protein PCIT_b0562 [Pseudoalteromonas citrea]